MIERELLAECGLNGTEQKVLLDLLQRAGSSAGMLARRVGIKRTTVYSALQSLEALGLVLRRKEGSATVYTTVPPRMVPSILCNTAEEQFSRVRRASELLSDQMTQYERLTKQHVAGYEISTTDSKDAAFLLLYQALLAGDLYAIWDPQTAAVGAMEDYLLDFLSQTAETQPKVQDIVVDGPKAEWYRAQVKNPHHEVKILPASYSIITDFVIVNDSVYLTNYSPGGEMLIQITHRDYYNSMQSLFAFMWSHLPPC